MLANTLLAILIFLMIIRDGQLAVRHRRPFRVAFLVFWVLLLAAHLTGRSTLYPAVAMSLIAGILLKMREVSRLGKTSKVSGKLGPQSKPPTLWDREIDGF